MTGNAHLERKLINGLSKEEIAVNVNEAPRRVVTGHDETGKAIVVIDAPVPHKVVREGMGATARLVWSTNTTPDIMSGKDDRAATHIGFGPTKGGTVVRVVDYAPIKKEAKLDPHLLAKQIGDAHADSKAWPIRHPFMHRTRTCDYAFVLSGEIDMLLDDSEVHLKSGDILVQQGTNHAWVNRSNEICRIAFVLVDAVDPLA
jgi:mannose-6-phosphate isomerase-like protein (cupin superfamily)